LIAGTENSQVSNTINAFEAVSFCSRGTMRLASLVPGELGQTIPILRVFLYSCLQCVWERRDATCPVEASRTAAAVAMGQNWFPSEECGEREGVWAMGERLPAQPAAVHLQLSVLRVWRGVKRCLSFCR